MDDDDDLSSSLGCRSREDAGTGQLELVKQMECLTNPTRLSPSENALEVDRMTIEAQRALNLPTREIGAPLAGTLIPWIDRDMPGGQAREE